MNEFTVLDISYCFLPDSVQVTTRTNIPIYLTSYYTAKLPVRHKFTRVSRGLSVPWGAYFCFVAWNTVTQLEVGDTLTHTHIIPSWQYCQRRYFTFKGTVAGIDSPSIAPLFGKHHLGFLPITFTIGSPPMDRPGEYGNVVGATRFLINLTSPSTVTDIIRRVQAFFSTATPGYTGYLVIFYQTAPGIFSSRNYAQVTFPGSTGHHTWDCPLLSVRPGDFIGIGMPVALLAPDYGIDAFAAGGSGVRHNQAGLTLPIVNQPFALYPNNIISLQACG